MNSLPPPDAPPPAEFSPTASARALITYDRLAHVHTLVLGTILSLLVLSLGLNLFIFKQMQGVRTQLAAAREMNRRLADQYRVKEPAMRQFVTALQTFASSHPAFQPVLQRYRTALPQFFTDVPVSRPNTLGNSPVPASDVPLPR